MEFQLPESFYNTLHQSMQEIQNVHQTKANSSPYSDLFLKVHGVLTEKDIPDIHHLKTLIETSFWASLEREEGRLLSFSVVYDEPYSSNIDTVSFREQEEYTLRRLTKIAPAIGSAKNSALVFTNDKRELVIWGLSKATLPTKKLSLKVFDPGRLTVSFNGIFIGAITGSNSINSSDGYIRGNKSVWDDIMCQKTTWEDYLQYRPYQADLMQLVVREVREIGHGGTIIVIGGGQSDEWKAYVKEPLAYPLTEPYSPVRGHLSSFSNTPSFESWRQLEEAARSIAELTEIDGAVVMTTEFDVLGFGVMVKPVSNGTEETLAYRMNLLNPQKKTEKTCLKDLNKTFTGSRHQSAVRFINDHRNAIAFVISQDKTVTAITWRYQDKIDEGFLFIYQGLESTIY